MNKKQATSKLCQPINGNLLDLFFDPEDGDGTFL
jgi:hypothetical protein